MTTDLMLDDCWNRIGVRGDQSCERLANVLHCRNCPAYEEAASRILQRRVASGYAAQWAHDFAAPMAVEAKGESSVMVFRISSAWLALPTACCLSIADLAPVHSLPHRSNPVLSGVVNVDGKLIAQLSLAALLHIESKQAILSQVRHVYARLMVLQLGGHAIAAPVDELHGIEHYQEANLQPLPATVNRSTARYLTGVMAIDALQVGCLDAELLGYNAAQVLR